MVILSNHEYSAERLQPTRQSSYGKVAWGCGLCFRDCFCSSISNTKSIYLSGIRIWNAPSIPSQLRNSVWQRFRQQIVKVAKQYKRGTVISWSSQTSIQQFLLLVVLRAEKQKCFLVSSFYNSLPASPSTVLCVVKVLF